MTTMPATALQRLLKYPHSAVFDKAPAPELVLRVRHQDGARWTVADEVMTVTAGTRERIYPLAGHTFGSLAAALQADGFEIPLLAAQWAGRSALAAVEGSGDQGSSNGDHIYAFTSLLWAMMSGYAGEVREAEYQVAQALRQMVLTQADGEWLDLWGKLYNEARRPGESDATYALRIPQEAFRIRVNALAIEQAIKDHTGKDIVIEEPWGYMFRLDESALSGGHRLYNGETVGYHLLRPVSRESIDWTDVLAVIERNRAAGVVVLDPEVRLGRWLDASIDGTIWSARASLWAVFVPFFSDNRLDYLVLSGEEITRNWPVMMSQLMTHSNIDPLLDPVSISQRRTIAKASIVLSDGVPLGDENAVLPRSELTRGGSEVHLSADLALSASDQRAIWKPVDFISTELHSRGEMDTGGPVAVSGARSTQLVTHRSFVDASIDGSASFSITAGFTWVAAGGWGDFPWSASQYEMLRIENIINRMHLYANYDLNEDLQQ